jgi:hypothetical protein
MAEPFLALCSSPAIVRLVWLRSAAKMLSSRNSFFLEDTLSIMESEYRLPDNEFPNSLKRV